MVNHGDSRSLTGRPESVERLSRRSAIAAEAAALEADEDDRREMLEVADFMGSMRAAGRHSQVPGIEEALTTVLGLRKRQPPKVRAFPAGAVSPGSHVTQDYATRSGKARVTAAVRLDTFSLP